MPTLIAGVVAVVLLYTLLQMFRAANPAVLARAIKIGGGVVALAVAAFTGIKGELAVAIPLGLFGAGLLGWSPFGPSGFSNIGAIFGGGQPRSAGQSSRVRSQFLDMALDHDSGELSGEILAGPHAGHSLGEFDLAQLVAMMPSFDAESVSLLESYLDRRFPAWRQDAQGDGAGRPRRGPPGARTRRGTGQGGSPAHRRAAKCRTRRPIRSWACGRGRAATTSDGRTAP